MKDAFALGDTVPQLGKAAYHCELMSSITSEAGRFL